MLRQYAAGAIEGVDRMLAEEVLVIPRDASAGGPYFTAPIDGTIGTYLVMAVCHVPDRILEAQRREAYTQDAMIQAAPAEIAIALTEFTEFKPRIQTGWEIQLVSRLEQTVLRVSSARQDGFGRLRCHCEVTTRHGPV